MVNSINLTTIDQEQALHLSKFFIRSNQNLFLFGQRGTGKTAIIMQAAAECKIKVNYINLSVIERPDLCGYPNMHDPGDTITFKSPQFLPKLIDKADSIILFDEVDKAPPEVTAPLLEILQFKSINGVPLNVSSCILTGNLTNEGAYSNLISTALLDRGAKYVLSFSLEKWIEWAKENNVHDLVIGFLKSNPQFACGDLEDTAYASPSPRGWTLASDALIKAKELKIVDLESIVQIVSGFVGCQAGIKFRMWYEYYRNFEPFVHAIIDSRNCTYEFHGLTPSEKIIFVISACYHAKIQTIEDCNKSKKFKYLENLCNFFSHYNVDKELQLIGLNNSFSFEQITMHKLYTCKNFFELFTKLNEGVIFKRNR